MAHMRIRLLNIRAEQRASDAKLFGRDATRLQLGTHLKEVWVQSSMVPRGSLVLGFYGSWTAV